MELANLGIGIDPTDMVRGSRRAQDELKKIGRSARDNLGRVEDEAKQSGRAMRGMARQGKQSFGALADGAIDFLDSLGLLNGGFGSLIRRSNSMVQSGSRLKSQMAAQAAATATTTAATNGFAGAMGGAAGAGGGMLLRLAPMIPMLAGIAAVAGTAIAAILGVAAAFKAVKASIPEAAALEAFEVRLAVIMGSFTEASAKIQELNRFADETPFSDPEIFGAGVKLSGMMEDGIDLIEVLKAVGGASFVAGKSMDEMVDLTNRLYTAIKVERDVLEPLKTMAGAKMVDPEIIKPVVALSEQIRESGDESEIARLKAEQWALVYDELKEKQVALTLASRTWNGMLSTIEGKWGALKAEFGEPIMDALKPMLTDATDLIMQLIPVARAAGEAVGNVLRVVIQAFQEGQLGDMAGASLAAGFEWAVDQWTGLVVGWLDYLGAELNAVYEFTGRKLGDFLGQAAEDGANWMMEAYGKVVQWLATQINKILVPLTSAASELGIGDVKVIGPRVGLTKPVEMFEPGNMTYQEARKMFGADAGAAAFVDARRGEDGLIGTDFRDSADKMASDLLERSRKQNKGFEDSDLGDLKPQSEYDPRDGTDPNGSATGGAAKGAEAQKEVQETINAFDDLMIRWGDLENQVADGVANMTASLAGNLTEALSGLIDGTKSAKEAFSQMATAIVQDIIRIVIQMSIQLAMQRAITAAGGGGWVGAIVGAGGAAAGGTATAHGGGRHDGSLSRTTVPKFHQGGTLSSEATVKVDRGETILTRRRAAELQAELHDARDDDRPARNEREATIINVLDRNEIADAIARSPGAVINAMSRNLPQVRKMVMSGERA